MKIIIAGSREEFTYEFVEEKITFIINPSKSDVIVSGCARGVDSHAIQYAKDRNLSCELFPADWDNLGRKAGPLRNIQMGDYADMLVAFWDGKSKGTKHMIDYMISINKIAIVICNEPYKIETYNNVW